MGCCLQDKPFFHTHLRTTQEGSYTYRSNNHNSPVFIEYVRVCNMFHVRSVCQSISHHSRALSQDPSTNSRLRFSIQVDRRGIDYFRFEVGKGRPSRTNPPFAVTRFAPLVEYILSSPKALVTCALIQTIIAYAVATAVVEERPTTVTYRLDAASRSRWERDLVEVLHI